MSILKLFLIICSIFLLNCSSSLNSTVEQIDKRFLQVFQYVYNSEDAEKLWIDYESPLHNSLPIIVYDKITYTQLIFFRKEILENKLCNNQITKFELDSIYLALNNHPKYLFKQNSFGPIEILSNVDQNAIDKKEFLVLVFSEPFKNLLEAELFHSSSMNSQDIKSVFGSSIKYLFCFSEDGIISQVFSKQMANN